MKNDKLFRGINENTLKTVRHAESKCHIWFETHNKREEIQSSKQTVTSKIWLGAHKHMTNSLMVSEPETKGEEFHLYIPKLEPFLRL